MGTNLLKYRPVILFLLLLPLLFSWQFVNLPTGLIIVHVIFIILLNILTYKWSISLLSGWWAILPPFLLIFSPDIIFLRMNPFILLAISISNLWIYALPLFYIAATYWLINFFFKPKLLNLFLSGLGFGLTQFAGMPALILIPYFLILILVFYLASVKRDWATTEPVARFKRFGLRGFKYFRSVIIIFIIGFLFSLIGYLFYEMGHTCFGLGGGCGAGSLIEYYDIPFWKDLTKSNFDISPAITYWPFIILTASAFIYSLINIIKSFRVSGFKGFWDYLGTSFPEFSMIVFIIMYLLFILFFSPGFNTEKLVPILPMVYILTASGLKRLWINIRS